jgi:hypothetical protein
MCDEPVLTIPLNNRTFLVTNWATEFTVEEIGESTEVFDDLCKDPWLAPSKLTKKLFLCPRACFIARDGQVVSVKRLTNLRDLCERAGCIQEVTDNLRAYFSGPMADPPWLQRCGEVSAFIEEKASCFWRASGG